MPKKRIAINGFGRIGRASLKIALEQKNLEIVAINDLTSIETLAHLLRYDTVYGVYDKKISVLDGNILKIGNKKIPVFTQPDPSKLPWKKLKVDAVLECTGFFVKNDDAYAHIKAGAKRVVISAPHKGEGKVDTCLIGVNDDKPVVNKVVSNASCTTNSVAPITATIDAKFGIKKALLTTIHAYTGNQNLVDGPNKDLRRSRAAALNIVPTSTGAAIAVTKIIPTLENKFDGLAVRVPIACGSLSDITFVVNKKTTVEEVNKVLKKASRTHLSGILGYSEDPIVSSDIIGTTLSSIVDAPSTKVVDGDLIKILAWYDNEWGYSNRLIELVTMA